MISDVIVGKPNKALNVVFLIFGYVLASYIISSIELVFEQQVPAVIVAGGVFSTFLYYVKPVDRLIKFYLLIRRRRFSAAYFGSPLLAEERAKINGAVFFSLSLLLASRLLSLINLYVPFELLLGLSVLMMIVALWETAHVIMKLIPIIRDYYVAHESGLITDRIVKAVENKNWDLAIRLFSNLKARAHVDLPQDYSSIEDWLSSREIDGRGTEITWDDIKKFQDRTALTSRGGFCSNSKCRFIVRRKGAKYCPKCGAVLITHCKSCYEEHVIVRHVLTEKMEEIPEFCDYCGKRLS